MDLYNVNFAMERDKNLIMRILWELMDLLQCKIVEIEWII